MTDAELLVKIKSGLGITGTFQDETLQVYVDEVKAFMLNAGINQKVINSSASVGCLMRGVADLWNYGSGNATLSDYFKMRLLQLKRVAMVFITQAQGTTIVVTKDGVSVGNETNLNYGDELKITVTGGTVKVNGEVFTSGNSYIVNGVVEIVSTASQAVNNNG